MRKPFARLLNSGVLLLLIVFMTGCYTHSHVVGSGSQQGVTETARQWYVAFGLAPITEVDTQELANGADNYLIETQQTFIDGLIGVITGGLISPRTVTVTR